MLNRHLPKFLGVAIGTFAYCALKVERQRRLFHVQIPSFVAPRFAVFSHCEAVESIKKGDPETAEAEFDLATKYLTQDSEFYDPAKGVALLKIISNDGSMKAQYSLAVCFEKGHGVPVNKPEAVRLLKQAANQGHAMAQCCLGWQYMEGDGVAKNEREGVRYMQLAADQGMAAAQCFMGCYYLLGYGIPKDTKLAVEFFELAAAQDNAKSNYLLGVFYQLGYDVAKDREHEIKYFQRAAEQGHLKAQVQTAALCEQRDKIEDKMLANFDAFKYYKMAADKGHPFSATMVGIYYLHGAAIELNSAEGLRYLNFAAKHGERFAQTAIAAFQHYGQGAPKGRLKGLGQLKLTAAQECVLACGTMTSTDDVPAWTRTKSFEKLVGGCYEDRLKDPVFWTLYKW